ncbi:MAG: Gfo/Idh/MocA family oxidoreductase, partial [Bacteroidota bacterium]
QEERATLTGLVTATGPSAVQKGGKFGFSYVTTDLDSLLRDDATDALFIATRHSTHAEFTVRALAAGKHVFVEKPMVVSEEQLAAVTEAYEVANRKRPIGLMVGLNRRFAPMVGSVERALAEAGAKQMIYRVNSGAIPTSSWLHDPEEGGGMLVGEMCHFLDVMRFLAGAPAVQVYATQLRLDTDALAESDNTTIVVTYADGSTGTLCYSTVGDKVASKERLEVYAGGSAVHLDDFRRLEIIKGGKRTKQKAYNQDKGQVVQVAETVSGFRTKGQAPIPIEELVEVMATVFAARRSLATGQPEKPFTGSLAAT